MEDYREFNQKRGRGRKARPQQENTEPSLFDQPRFAPTDPRTAHRHPDKETSVEAAERATRGSQRLKALIYEAFVELGPMTDGELEKLERFAAVPAINSIRKRRTDLLQEGRIEDAGERRGHPDRPNSRMIVWRRVR